MKVLTVVGNRPQFIKAAAVSGPLRSEHEEVLVHTGQHFDDALSAVFFLDGVAGVFFITLRNWSLLTHSRRFNASRANTGANFTARWWA